MTIEIKPAPSISVGKIVQVVNTQTGTYSTANGVIPYDNTIPQKTEGREVMTRTITPVSAANKLKIDVIAHIGHYDQPCTAALFQNSLSNALACGVHQGRYNQVFPVVFTHFMIAGTTSMITFKVRVGCTSGNIVFNGRGNGDGPKYGGVLASSITVTEIKV